MPRNARYEQADTVGDNRSLAYAPSWIDRFTAWVDRLPGPPWSYYLAIGLVAFLAQTAVLWGEGALPINSRVHYVHGFIACVIALFLLLFHYLDERAAAALKILRPALKAPDEEYRGLNYQLTTLPARATLLASLAALAFLALVETLGEHYCLEWLNAFPISGHVLRFFYLLIWWLFGAFLYHTFHQLRLINCIYTHQVRINLFRMRPLYALSSLAALTAGSLAMIPYGFLLVNPSIDFPKDPLILSSYLVITSMAVATFVWPQLGIHGLQVEEKERLLDEANQRFEATILELHQRVDSENLEGVANVNMAIESLEVERNALRKIPTWPWEPEAVRLLITALALPLGLWIAQYALQSMLGS